MDTWVKSKYVFCDEWNNAFVYILLDKSIVIQLYFKEQP